MIFPASLRLHRCHLPVLALLALLQRAPALRTLAGGSSLLVTSPAAQILRAAFGLAALGAVDTLAGATTFVMSPAGNPVRGTVGAALSLAFTYTGTPSPPQQFAVSGTLPPGLSFIPAPMNGFIRSGTPAISGTPTQAGSYRIQIQGFGTLGNGQPVPIDFAITGDTPAPITARLTNLSVRAALADGQRLIVGLAVSGGGARDVLVRAAGPALLAFGLAGAMVDPRLELYRESTPVLQNNDWPPSLATTFASVGAFAFSPDSRDAALLQAIDGVRSIHALGSGPGTVLVEAYDTGAPTAARLVNVSARNRVGTGDDILIAGFTISGTGNKRLLIRAVGPKLGEFGVTGFLADPKLEIYDAIGGKLTENDNWPGDLATTFASVGAFALNPGSPDAALIATLPPGSYTAQVRGADGGTGEALIEIYELR